MSQSISITRALAELKSLKGRIDAAINEGTFVAVAKGKGDRKTVHNSAAAVNTVETTIRSSFQTVTDLIARRNALKRAVIASNAVTSVTIGGQSMTVAEAVDRKASIEMITEFHRKLRNQFSAANQTVVNGNEKLSQQIEQAVISAYGSDAKARPSEEAYAAVAEPRRRDHELSLIDPCNIAPQMDALAKHYNEFITEVDYVLSESNARTLIEV